MLRVLPVVDESVYGHILLGDESHERTCRTALLVSDKSGYRHMTLLPVGRQWTVFHMILRIMITLVLMVC